MRSTELLPWITVVLLSSVVFYLQYALKDLFFGVDLRGIGIMFFCIAFFFLVLGSNPVALYH